MSAEIRKIVVTVEETHREGGAAVSPVTRKAAAVAVIANPCAGPNVADLKDLVEIGVELERDVPAVALAWDRDAAVTERDLGELAQRHACTRR